MKTSVFARWLLPLVLLITSLGTTGCFAASVPPQVPTQDVWALSAPSTLSGINSVLNGTMNFGVCMVKDNILVVMWPIKDMGWASIFVDVHKLNIVTDKTKIFQMIGQAGIFNSKSMGDFTLALKSNGFVQITAAQVPVFISAAFASLNSMKSVPVLVLPAGYLEDFGNADGFLDPIDQ